MFVCKTLNYIVNTDLHLYLFEKFNDFRSKGIRVEIKLTEPIVRIPMESGDYIKLMDMVLNNAMKYTDKRIEFYMFYTDRELHLVVRYASSEARPQKLTKNKNVQYIASFENATATEHLIVMP